jgi:hypothetical protein
MPFSFKTESLSSFEMSSFESSLEGGVIKEYVKEVLREVHPGKGLNLIAIN